MLGVAPPPRRRSLSNTVASSGTAHCSGWCSTSPVITARSPPLSIVTLTWPGVWPGVGKERDFARDRVVRFDEVDEARVDDGLHRVAEQVAVR